MTSLDFLMSVGAGVVACEIYLWLPWIAARLIKHHVSRLPKSVQDRALEEWTADSATKGSHITRLMFAMDLHRAVRSINRELLAEYDEERQPAGYSSTLPSLGEAAIEARLREARHSLFGRVATGLVQDLSHPLENISNSCKLIAKMHDDPEYRQLFARTVDREVAHMKRALEDLRNVGAPLPLDRFRIDISRTVAEVVEVMQPVADTAGVILIPNLGEGPIYVDGDWFALARVFRNLLLNALQATAPNGRIIVRAIRLDAQAVIEVNDTGCGIPQDRMGTIFDDFYTTKRRGLGLGLAISRKIVEQLGGKVSVRSEVGVGTSVTVRFPLKT